MHLTEHLHRVEKSSFLSLLTAGPEGRMRRVANGWLAQSNPGRARCFIQALEFDVPVVRPATSRPEWAADLVS